MSVPDPTLTATPPIPDDLREFPIALTDNARTVLRKRYLRRGEDGKPAESEQGMFWRVAYNIALAEIEHGGTTDTVEQIARRFFHLLVALQFFPNSPTFTGAGTPLGQLAACFTADMRVTTSLGQTRIADLAVGDLVLTHTGRYQSVQEVYQRPYNGDLLRMKIHSIGTTLEVTPEHPILTPRGWIKAGELKAGDEVAVGQLRETAAQTIGELAAVASFASNRFGYAPVIDLDAREYVRIDRITFEHFEGIVYNCEVQDDHSYVTEGVVVHNCFVLAIDDDMGRSETGIFQTLRNAALIQQTGGGNGFAFSRLRPKGAIVRSSNGQATGPVGFLRVYDQAFGEIAQGGCLTPDTLVFTNRGLLRLDEIVTQARPGWYTHNLTVPTDEGDRQSAQGYNNGVAPVFKVSTEAGIQLTGTANHKIKVKTAFGTTWRMIGDLQPGDQVMFKLGQHRGEIQPLRAQNDQFPTELDARLAFLIGYLIGSSGDFSDKGDDRISFTVSRKNAAMTERIPHLIQDVFGTGVTPDIQLTTNETITFIVDNSAVKAYLHDNDLISQRAKAGRYVPRAIRQSPANVASAFLSGLFEAAEQDSSALAVSKRLTAEINTLLIGLGFVPFSRQMPQTDRFKIVATTNAPVRIVGTADVADFSQPVDGVWFTVVTSIEPAGESLTLDLEVEDNHTYLANGMVVHNSRRGANMAVLRVDHPDVRDFITCKTDESKITNFNISVGITDAFMRAVESDGMYDLINPQDNTVWETVRAREIYDLIVKYAHHNGEPGVLFLDAANRQNPVPHLYTLESTNPCVPGETQVATPEGWKRVDLIKEGDEICTVLGTGRVATIEVHEAMPVYKVTLSDGGTIRATAAHQFHVHNIMNTQVFFPELRRLDELKRGDLIRTYHPAMSASATSTIPVHIRLSTAREQTHAAGIAELTPVDSMAKILSIEPDGIERVYDLYEPKSDTWITNGYVSRGCGEQWLGPFENCCLGSINVAKIATEDGKVDWEKFRDLIETSTRFLDDVVTANKYVPAVPQLKEAAHRVRRIGLGIMGLADLMYALGVRYGSEEGQEFAGQLSEFLRYHAMKTSIALAEERGPFPAIKGSIYDQDNMIWQPPRPLFPYTRNWSRPHLDWTTIVSGIKQYGIRNGAQTTVAPTGTIATVSGCEGYGCEPVFALAYVRHVNDQGKDLQLQYTSPLLEKALHNANLSADQMKVIIDEVNATGTCQNVANIPEHIRHTFVVSSDISGEEHIRMQAAMQAFVDNAISKCVTGDTLVMTAQGLSPISELSDMRLPDQFEPLAIDVHTPSGIERTDAFFYGGMRETRRVELSYGYRVEGTPNHRIQVLDADGHIKFSILDDLKIGQTVVMYAGQNVFGPAEPPLPAYSGPMLTNASPIHFPAQMSAELAYVLGCITSEEAITINGVGITNGDRALLEKLGQQFKALFGLNSHIYKDNRRESVYTLQVNSRLLRYWLLEDLRLSAGARNKIIPTCILRASKGEIAAFLRGLFLDAYMTLDGRMFGIGLATLKLIRQLQTLMLNFGVVSSIHRGAENAWVLTVSGAALDKLAAFVSFDEVWKNQRIAIRNEGRDHRLHNYIDRMPRALTTALQEMHAASDHSLRSLYGGQTQAYQRARVNLLQDHRLDRETAHQLYGHFNDAANAYAEAFLTDDRPEAIYVEVKALTSGFAEVYDLSVPGSHTFIANGLGNHNTCNFPDTATESDVAAAYMLGWKLGVKGMTVYVTGSRDKVVLETHATAQTKQADPVAEVAPVSEPIPETASIAAAPPPTPQVIESAFAKPVKKSRPHKLVGRTYRVETPLGKTYVTINENGAGLGYPFEIFTHTSKAGSDTAAVSEAIGRLISLMLRLRAPLSDPRDRLKEIARELDGIGGGRPTGFGAARVRSLPDGIARVLQEYLDETEDHLGTPTDLPPKPIAASVQPTLAAGTSAPAKTEKPTKGGRLIGDLCPECGEATLINEEGCRKCYTCGYSEC